MAVHLAKRLLTIEEYHRMSEAGILTEADRVELLDGEIYQMSPIGSEHGACVKRLNQLLNQLLGEKVIVSVQDPVQIPELSEPEPDIALLAPRSDFYADAHPLPEEIFLIIEVANTSYEKDKLVKLPIYARAGILEYWIVNLEKGRVEIFQKPQKGSYVVETVAGPGEQLPLRSFGVQIAFEKIMG